MNEDEYRELMCTNCEAVWKTDTAFNVRDDRPKLLECPICQRGAED